MTSKYQPLSRNESNEENGVFPDTETDKYFEPNMPSMPNKTLNIFSKSILVTIAFIITFSIMLLGSRAILQEHSRYRKSPVPLLPTETLVFENHSVFNDPPTPENDALWRALLGPGMGFVGIQNPSQYGLPQGIDDEHTPKDTQVFGISMYHQLHCLMMIRDAYWVAIQGERTTKMMMGLEAEGEEHTADMHHERHCFDYLRQSIMCSADMSLEGASISQARNGINHINGHGTRHECKSYQASRDWIDAHAPGK